MVEIINLIFCAGIFGMGFCRVRKMNRGTRDLVFWGYAILAVAALGVGIAAMWPEKTGISLLLAVTCLTGGQFIVLASMGGMWARGLPRSAQKK